MSGNGYGIAGHTGTYTTGVRCGNWVEDVFGRDQALGRERNPCAFDGVTESNSHFSHPNSKPPRNMGPDDTGNKPSMRGLEQHLLLAHCEKGNLHHASSGNHERYQTTHRNSFYGEDRESGQMPVANKRALARKLKLEKQLQMTGFETTSSIESNKPFLPREESEAKGGEERKTHGNDMSFTKQFLQSQAFNNIRKCD